MTEWVVVAVGGVWLLIVASALLERLLARGGDWWIVTVAGAEHGPFRSEVAAQHYPGSLWGAAIDGESFRDGWRIERREADTPTS